MLTSSKFVDIIPRSWHCQHPSIDGLPVASTMLNLILADLSLKETFKVATPRFSISEPPISAKDIAAWKDSNREWEVL